MKNLITSLMIASVLSLSQPAFAQTKSLMDGQQTAILPLILYCVVIAGVMTCNPKEAH